MTRSLLQPLPIDKHLDEACRKLAESGALVLAASPGAGKTTRVPVAISRWLRAHRTTTEHGGGGPQRVVVLEPRRLAARAAAQRIAEEQGWEIGQEVGYQIRFEHRFQASTQIVFVTEGVLLQWIQRDPFLEGFGCVVLDEVHERNLHADLALALLHRLRRDARRDLLLVVMSATIDDERFARFLQAPLLRCEGRLFPVHIDYLSRPARRALPEQVVSAVVSALQRDQGSVLAFLPGVGEIERCSALLRTLVPTTPVLPLHGSLPLEKQHQALRGTSTRVVLATNVAETSVTVEGIGAVVDSGFQRSLRFDPRSGLDRLDLVRVSRASAEQRSGRAGRLGPGWCLRLWTAAEHGNLLPFEKPEILRVDLAWTVLQLLALGEKPEGLEWLDAPRPAELEVARKLLVELGALTSHRGRWSITALGKTLAQLPLHPRLGRLVLTAHEQGNTGDGALLAALLSEADIFRREESTGQRAAGSSDLLDRLEAVRRFSRDRENHRGQENHRGAAPGRLMTARAQRVLEAARQIERLLDFEPRRPGMAYEAQTPASREHSHAEKLGRALLAAFPERVAQRLAATAGKAETRAVLADGAGVEVSPASVVQQAPLFLCLEFGGKRGERTLVHSASAIEREWLPEEQLALQCRLEWLEHEQRVVSIKRSCYRVLVLEEHIEGRPRDPGADELLIEHCRGREAEALGLDRPPASELITRLDCLREWRPDLALPEFGPDQVKELLRAAATGRSSLAELRNAPILDLLRAMIGYRELEALDELAPVRLSLPNGRGAAILYERGKAPVLAARIQDFFGWNETPRIAGDRVTLLLHLLAPNRRPQQITDDLAGFWQGTYQIVRKELAGRYPKHSWPPDPLATLPSLASRSVATSPRGRGAGAAPKQARPSPANPSSTGPKKRRRSSS